MKMKVWLFALILGCLAAPAVSAGEPTESSPEKAAGYVSADSSGKVEGEGFDTPEEALGAYIRALKENDIDAMLAAFAVETYAENYSLLQMTERLQVYHPSIRYIPNVSGYAIRLNVENRRSEIMSAIRNQYLALQGSEVVLGENANSPLLLKDYDSAEALLGSLFVPDDSGVLGKIEFRDEFYDPSDVHELYADERNRENMLKQGKTIGAEDVASAAARFYCGGEPVAIMADAVRYGGRWYLNTLGGNLGALLGLDVLASGTMPLKYDTEGLLPEIFK